MKKAIKHKFWRQFLPSGYIVYRVRGMPRDKSVRVMLKPIGNYKYTSYHRNASWFDFIRETKSYSKSEAMIKANEFMKTTFWYD